MTKLDGTFWLNRRVLVTGHTGFKGTWLCAWLTELGADVIGLGYPPTMQAPLHRAAALEGKMVGITADIRDREHLAREIAMRDPEIIFHLAAQPQVLAGLKNPAETFEVNTLGTMNLLEAARRSHDLRAVIVVTTDKCYRDSSTACDEDAPLGGADPYAASKSCAEIVAHCYAEHYLQPEDGIGVATARAGNVIGGGDLNQGRLLPDLVRAARAGQPVVLKYPEAIRPWQHVLDALHGYLLLAQACAGDPLNYSGAWNFGPGEQEHWNVGRVAGRVAGRLGGSVDVCRPSEVLETLTLRLSAAKAECRLGWRPALDTGRAIDWAISGYERLLDTGEGSWLYEQISQFEDRIGGWGAARRAPAEEMGDRDLEAVSPRFFDARGDI